MKFEWDTVKDNQNQEKHGISFSEAMEVFFDPLHLSILDKRYTYFEERWITIGQVKDCRIIVVANLYFSEHGEEVIRIVSAREATVHERKQYEEL